MKPAPSWLSTAVQRGIITGQQADALWTFAQTQTNADVSAAGADAPDTPAFRPAHILYYLGGLVAIGAMTLFMTLGWERFGHGGLLAIALIYALIGLGVTEWLIGQKLRIPAGLTAAFTLVLVPLAVYALQGALGLWSNHGWAYRDYHRWVDGRWVMMELATLAAGALMLWRYRLPFLVMPVAGTLWYMSMDLSDLLTVCHSDYGCSDSSWNRYQIVSAFFGLAVLLAALAVDLRTRGARREGRDHAFWLYLAGLMAFWGGLTAMDSGSQWSKFGYLCINLLLIAAGAILSRRAFAVFGGLGVAGYLGGYLAWDFRNSMMFPFVLTLIGFAIIGLGILWQRREQAISQRLRGLLPGAWQERLETMP